VAISVTAKMAIMELIVKVSSLTYNSQTVSNSNTKSSYQSFQSINTTKGLKSEMVMKIIWTMKMPFFSFGNEDEDSNAGNYDNDDEKNC